MGFVIKSGVADFLPSQTEAVDLSFFPTTVTREPGTAKSSKRPKMTTLRRGNDALETRHLSHPRARNSVVLSILLKVVLMNGIAALHGCNIIMSTEGRVCFAAVHGAHQHRS